MGGYGTVRGRYGHLRYIGPTTASDRYAVTPIPNFPRPRKDSS